MDSEVMELRLQKWMPILEAQAKSGLNKQEWCEQNGIKRADFFKWQRECRAYLISKNKLAQAKNEPTFVEISCEESKTEVATTFANTNSLPDSSAIVITYNGFSVSISGQVDEINLSKVIKVISYVH